jgi:MarR family transcriptional regulator, organic hydroperoxide resistance regulator
LDAASAGTPDDDPEQWPLVRLLLTAAHLVELHFEEHLRDFGLTQAGFIVLALLESGPMNQRELAGHARVEEQTMGRTVERLERLGHLTRRRDPSDLRRMLVQRTPSGTEAFIRSIRRDVVGEALADLPDAAAFRTQLAYVMRRFDERSGPAE